MDFLQSDKKWKIFVIFGVSISPSAMEEEKRNQFIKINFNWFLCYFFYIHFLRTASFHENFSQAIAIFQTIFECWKKTVPKREIQISESRLGVDYFCVWLLFFCKGVRLLGYLMPLYLFFRVLIFNKVDIDYTVFETEDCQIGHMAILE